MQEESCDTGLVETTDGSHCENPEKTEEDQCEGKMSIVLPEKQKARPVETLLRSMNDLMKYNIVHVVLLLN